MALSDSTFRDEYHRLHRISGVFWGPKETYTDGAHGVDNPLELLPRVAEAAGWRVPMYTGGRDDGFFPTTLGLETSDRLMEIDKAAGAGREAFRDAVLEVTGIDLTAADATGDLADLADGRPSLKTELGTEAFGCYLPWHAFGESTASPWGIYIFLDALLVWTAEVWQAVANDEGKENEVGFSQLFELLFSATLRHELFHYHVERFATRFEVAFRQPVYRPYVEKVKAKVANSDDWLEEAMAQAVVLNSRLIGGRTGLSLATVRRILEPEFELFPEGYRMFCGDPWGGVPNAHRYFAAQVARGVRDIAPGEESTELATPLIEYGSNASGVPGYAVWSPPSVYRFQLQTPKRRAFEKFARRSGMTYVGPGPGDHQRWQVNGSTVQINYRNGELDLASLKAMARALGIKVRELCERVRQT